MATLARKNILFANVKTDTKTSILMKNIYFSILKSFFHIFHILRFWMTDHFIYQSTIEFKQEIHFILSSFFPIRQSNVHEEKLKKFSYQMIQKYGHWHLKKTNSFVD